MAVAVIKPAKLKGSVTVPPSKSVAHRAVIARALAGGGEVRNLEISEDIKATNRCISALSDSGTPLFDCGESGSTLRFMIPIALSRFEKAVFTGSARLPERSLVPYEKLFNIEREGSKIIVSGTLKSGVFELDGGVSSQFVTGLLFALPLLSGDSSIVMTSPLQSKPYVDLTLSTLRAFGVEAENQDYARFNIKGGQSYKPCDFTVEGDYSQAAFWLVANALGSDIAVNGLNPHSEQGDRAIEDIIAGGEKIVDVTDIPDLVPILAVLFSLRPCETRIVGASRLRLKECDRLNVITRELNKLGANITELEDSLIINGVETLRGAEVEAPSDHRIAMALAVAATRCEDDVTVRGAECVAKSYPAFWEDYAKLGGRVVMSNAKIPREGADR